MTAADTAITSSASTMQASGRWSGRVAMASHQPTEDVGPGRISAPESFTAFSGSASPAERGPKAKPEPRAASDRMSRGQTERVARSLSDRDRAILNSVSDHRFLTTAHIERFHFADHLSSDAAGRICRRVLQRLHQLRVLEHLDRRVGGVRAGSASYVWRVGLIGDRLLRLGADDDQPRARRKEPSLRHLEHCLAIADTHLMLRDLAASGSIELLQLQTEPRCWRTSGSLGFGGSVLKPDLYTVTASGDYEDHWFCEVDRATESLPTLLRKCVQYEAYRRTGSEQDRLGVFPLVVWVVPDQARADKLRRSIASSRSLDRDLYRICTPNTFPALILGGDAL
jgi:Replication-relaxation